ncbi:MFS transporter [Tenacibaculum sp. 190524A05c]|uniref:MFS domain-containing protein n=1 Tax=Tenacibaculum platacis TaxID=3137852 RepID=A0ABP1EC25_9FLAO
MQKILNQKHSKETFLYTIMNTLERASYYGIRALFVIYMIGETLKMEHAKAFEVYGIFFISIIFSKIIGAVVGDLFIGNKKAIIIGGLIQALGAFSLCNPSIYGLYSGLFLISIGSGFFTTNLHSNFGKLYLEKLQLSDAGFTILYLSSNLGSFFGILLLGYLGEKYGYSIGFLATGFLTLLSIAPLLFIKEKSIHDKIIDNKISFKKRLQTIFITFSVVGLFWLFYELASVRNSDLIFQFSEISALNISRYLWNSLSAIFILPISLIAILLWTFFYINQISKLTLGLLFAILSLGILLFIPEIPLKEHVYIYIGSLLLFSISEILIAPVVQSTLTKYGNPKYLAILMSIISLPVRLFTFLLIPFKEELDNSIQLSFNVGLTGIIILTLGFISYTYFNSRKPKQTI